MGLLSNRVSRENLVPGDHIYSWRFAYTYAHHGIYIGDDFVIHFTRGPGEETGSGSIVDKLASSISSPSSCNSMPSIPCLKCGTNADRNGVVLSCLDCFLCGHPLYRFEYNENTVVFLAKARGGTCTLAKSDPPEEVLHRARYLLANGFGCYHIFHNNCEDFAIYCKTGLLVLENTSIGRSGQAASFLGVPFAAVSASPLRFLMSQPLGLLVASAGIYCVSRYAADIGVRKDVAKIAVEDLAFRIGPPQSKTCSQSEESSEQTCSLNEQACSQSEESTEDICTQSEGSTEQTCSQAARSKRSSYACPQSEGSMDHKKLKLI